MDESSKRKSHDHITQFVDWDTRKTIFVTDGRDASTFKAFSKTLVERNGKIENIEAISMDISKSFISGALSCFPNAGIIFGRFHIFKAGLLTWNPAFFISCLKPTYCYGHEPNTPYTISSSNPLAELI